MKGVFTTRVVPDFDDLPERQYHFPRTYLRQVEACVGDWVIYYEPRRSAGNQPTGRQAYFATAMGTGVRQDRRLDEHSYADVQGYFEFPRAVPFREQGHYFEPILRRPDGQNNHGAFGQSIRSLPDEVQIERHGNSAINDSPTLIDRIVTQAAANSRPKQRISPKDKQRKLLQRHRTE
jgi:putative restriction endonuclease